MTMTDAERLTSPRIAPEHPAPGAAPAASSQPGTLAIAATFTAEGIADPLGFMLDAAGLGMQIEFAPYHQVFQELLSPQSLLGRNASGADVILLRLEDFVRDAAAGSDLAEILKRTADELLDAARQFAQRAAVPALYVIFGPSPAVDESLANELAKLNRNLADALDRIPNAVAIRGADVDRLCDTPAHDPIADRMAHAPCTDDYLSAVAIALVRRIHLQRVASHKVLVLDCDNTLWRGVVGEDGVQGIGLAPAFLAVQAFAVAAQSRGTLVCLASKNSEADVMEVFESRPDMRLAREHIVAHRINWEPKPANLRALARELNLGLDSFVFLDDNPVECGAMREALPEVVTLQLPADDDVAAFLEHLWVFDKASITQEDQQRTEMYRQNAARETLEASTADIGEFLASLELRIAIAPPNDDEWARMAQLTQRTNQFNFTTRRRTEPEMRALAASRDVLAVHVSDRFGDYGLVGAMVATTHPAHLEVDTFLLSCRVLGRGVEHEMVAHLGRLAASRGAASLVLPLLRTAKNEPALAFANSILARFRQESDAAVTYTVPADIAAAIRHRAGEDAEEVLAARRADAAKPGKRATEAPTDRSARYARLASELATGSAVTAAWQAAKSVEQRPLSAAQAPRTATERSLAALWEEILGVRGIGVDDDFFALGGSSLQAARMIAEVAHRRAVTLPLTTIVEAPTIRAFAGRVDGGDVAAASGLVPLRLGGPRKLFLVHDGDGETLLYRNIARRAPADLSVYGIRPQRRNGIPLAHLSIEEMAAAYVRTIREEQAQGPYLVGGMCAGGLIAYEMATQLQRDGQQVDRVLILDAAAPGARHRAPPADALRSSRLRAAMKAAGEGRGALSSVVGALGVLASKVRSVVAYESGRIGGDLANRLKLGVLRRVLRSNGTWPRHLPGLDFRAIYNHAERHYAPAAAAKVRALLIRARAGTGTGNDVPYIDVFEDPQLGWGRLIPDLEVVDVDGGHSSMLQEPHAASLASALRPHLGVRRPVAGPAA